MKKTIIGIDLGTTNSVIAAYQQGRVRELHLNGQTTIPSVVHVTPQGISVGHNAKKRLMIHPEQVLSSTKRFIGRTWQQTIDGRSYDATDAAEHILAHLKREGEQSLGGPIRDVVITIPAYFDEDQRRATRQAAERAGLQVMRLIPEPTAAAIAYGLDKEKDQTLLVFDLGGGTFDASVLKVQSNDFIVQAVDGDSSLGGDDFDHAVVEDLLAGIRESHGEDLGGDPAVLGKLKQLAEETKIALSQQKTTSLNLPGLAPGIDLDIDHYSRERFETLIRPLVEAMVDKAEAVIAQSGLTIDDINRIVLVGGSCKTPLVREVLARRLKQPYLADEMDTYVARGAALVAAGLTQPDDLAGHEKPIDLHFKDVIPHSLGVSLYNNEKDRNEFRALLVRNTHYPSKNAIFTQTVLVDQASVRFDLYRGEDRDPEHNTLLGDLTMDVTNRFRGKDHTRFAAIFELDENGELTLSAAEISPSRANLSAIQAVYATTENDEDPGYAAVQQLVQRLGLTPRRVTVRGIGGQS